MAAEKEFPKIGGDIIYASEVNRFAGANEVIAGGSTDLILLGSVSKGTEVGSIFISGGQFNDGDFINIDIMQNHSAGGLLVTDVFLSGPVGSTGFLEVGSTIQTGYGNVIGYLKNGDFENINPHKGTFVSMAYGTQRTTYCPESAIYSNISNLGSDFYIIIRHGLTNDGSVAYTYQVSKKRLSI